MGGFSYEKLTLSLTTARVDYEHSGGGPWNFLLVIVPDVAADLKLRFDSREGQIISARTGDKFFFGRHVPRKIKEKADGTRELFLPEVSFDRVFITSSAITAGDLELSFGLEMEVEREIRVTADMIQQGLDQEAVTVGVVATPLPAASLTDRVNVLIHNFDAATEMYVGNSLVTTANGMPVMPRGYISWTIVEGVPVYGIVAEGTVEARVMEGA